MHKVQGLSRPLGQTLFQKLHLHAPNWREKGSHNVLLILLWLIHSENQRHSHTHTHSLDALEMPAELLTIKISMCAMKSAWVIVLLLYAGAYAAGIRFSCPSRLSSGSKNKLNTQLSSAGIIMLNLTHITRR